jgi:hypothetical protein
MNPCHRIRFSSIVWLVPIVLLLFLLPVEAALDRKYLMRCKAEMTDASSRTSTVTNLTFNIYEGTPIPLAAKAADGWSEWIDLFPMLPGDDEADVMLENPVWQSNCTWKVTCEFRHDLPGLTPNPVVLTDSASARRIGMVLPRRAMYRLNFIKAFRTLRDDTDARLKVARQIPEEPFPDSGLVIATDLGFGQVDKAIGDMDSEIVRRLGFNTVGTDDQARAKDFPYRWHGEYFPVNYFPWMLASPEKDLLRNYQRIREDFVRTGGQTSRLRLLLLADEPTWQFKKVVRDLRLDLRAREQFQRYLAGRGMQPSDLGASDWGQVKPITRDLATDAAGRRLFLWTCRFIQDGAAEQFAMAAHAVETVFGKQTWTGINYNNFNSESYSPSADSSATGDRSGVADGRLDWFKAGEKRASSLMWTEDWFGDDQMAEWDIRANLLLSSARRWKSPDDPVRIGTHLMPHCLNTSPEGVWPRQQTLIAYGAQAFMYWTYGPRFHYSGWTHFVSLYPAMTRSFRKAHAMYSECRTSRLISSPVALVWPQTCQMWAEPGENSFMEEVRAIYFTLREAGYMVELIPETALAETDLKRYRVVYGVGPHLPEASINPLLEWVKHGGMLWATPHFAERNEYDEPLAQTGDWYAKSNDPRGIWQLPPVTKVGETAGAVSSKTLGKGKIYFPAVAQRLKQPLETYPPRASRAVTAACTEAGVQPICTVSQPGISAIVRENDQRIFVYLLRWSGKAGRVEVKTGKSAATVELDRAATVTFKK